MGFYVARAFLNSGTRNVVPDLGNGLSKGVEALASTPQM